VSGGDVEILDPAARDVPLTGRVSVRLRPITVGQLPKFLRVIRPIIGQMTALGQTELEGGTAEIQLLDLYVEHGESVNQAVAIASDLPLEEIEALPLDDMLRLAVAVWEVNQDFFSQRVIPLLGPMLRVARPGVGPTP
jgi:hypothetical protein